MTLSLAILIAQAERTKKRKEKAEQERIKKAEMELHRQLEQAVRDGVEARLAAHRLELGVAHVDGRGLQWG